MCILNAQGHFFKALTKWFDYYPTPLEAEALGLREAIVCLGELGLSMVPIELDCKLVVATSWKIVPTNLTLTI